MKINLKTFLKKVKLTTVKNSDWFKDGYKEIQFRSEGLAMTHKKYGDFAWICPSEIEIEIPDNLINKPVETTNEQLKYTWYVVSCCGCTDCFQQAVFVDVKEAHNWANNNCKNPEGSIIKAYTDTKELIEALNYE